MQVLSPAFFLQLPQVLSKIKNEGIVSSNSLLENCGSELIRAEVDTF
jgi:hypothetical protein